MKKYIRSASEVDAERTPEEILSSMLSKLKDDFNYALDGCEKIAADLSVEDAIDVASELNFQINEAISKVSELITSQGGLEGSESVESSTQITASEFSDDEVSCIFQLDPNIDIFYDPEGVFGPAVSSDELREYWDNNCKDDPSLAAFDDFKSWYKVTTGNFIELSPYLDELVDRFNRDGYILQYSYREAIDYFVRHITKAFRIPKEAATYIVNTYLV